MKKIFKTLTACGLAGAMIVTSAVGTFAAEWTPFWEAPEAAIDIENDVDTNGNKYTDIITAAGHRAAQTLVEIVGLNNKAGQNMAGNKDGIVDGDADMLDPEYNWIGSSKDKVSESGTHSALFESAEEAANNCKILGIFGSDNNYNPDPYYYNYYYNCYALTHGIQGVDQSQVVMMINSSLSPNLADTIAPTDYEATGNVSCSVYTKADILIGANAATKGTQQTYVDYISELYESSDLYDDYNPIVFAYKYTDVYQEGESLQRLAVTMNNISTLNGSIKTEELNTAKGSVGRYDNPLITANNYQLYVKGLSAYVASQITEKKSVVVIDPASSTVGQTGDSQMPGEGWFRAYDNTTKDGLATKTRGAEAVENVTENLLQTYKDDPSKVYNFTATSDGNAYAITEAVVKEADVIIIQGAQSKIAVFTEEEFKEYMKANYGWTDADFANKTIIAENPQCVYGMTCNSSESAMAYGFYMGYIYPEVLNPVYASAFFYKVCLHITDADALQKFMDCNVAPYVEALNVSTTLEDGWYENIRSKIEAGVNYFEGLSDEAKAEFKFVSRVATGSDVQTGIFTDTYNEKEINTILSTSTVHTHEGEAYLTVNDEIKVYECQIKAATKADVTEANPWHYNGTNTGYGDAYYVSSVLENAGVDISDMHGLKFVASDGFVTGIDAEGLAGLVIYDQSEWYKNGNVAGEAGTFGLAIDGSAGNKWASDVVSVSVADSCVMFFKGGKCRHYCSICGADEEVVDGKYVSCGDGATGLYKGTDGAFHYYTDGVIDTAKNGFIDYDGGKFLIANGSVATEKSGLAQDPENTDIWYYLANGQAQLQYSGFAEYDGEWFILKDGVLDTTVNEVAEYDGGKFLFAAGRVVSEKIGLGQDPNVAEDWYYFAGGQAQIQYTGLAEYDGEWFYIFRGKLASDFTGSVEYNGESFNVVNGQVKF